MFINWSPMRKLIWLKASGGLVPDLPWQTFTGNPLSFIARTAHALKSCVVGIEPVQSGSGDPSPDNVRPISGFTGANVTRTGKNLLNTAFESGGTYNDVTFTRNSDGSFTVSGTANGTINRYDTNYAFLLKAGTYTLSGSITNNQLYLYKVGGSVVMESTNGNANTKTFTEDTTVYLRIRIGSGSAVSGTIKPQLESGSPATTYEAYNGTTYSVTWNTEAGTIYGGTLDVTTGVLTVDRASTTIGNMEWEYQSAYTRFYSATLAGIMKAAPSNTAPLSGLICSCYKTSTVSGGVDKSVSAWGSVDPGKMLLRDSSYTTKESLVAAVGSQTIVYPLATPVTYQLTAQQVSAIVGENNMWTDCATLTVEAKAMD